MLNRRHLRVKVLQVLYAFFQTSNNDLASGEKELFFNINKTYDLYLHQLLLISELGFVAEKYFDERKSNAIPGRDVANPDINFLENKLLDILRNSKKLSKACKDNKVRWSKEHDFIKKIFFHIRKTDLFKRYVESTGHTFENDKNFLIKAYSNHICEIELLHNFYEDKSIYWIDDWELVINSTVKTLRSIQPHHQDIELQGVYKDEEDKEFARNLFSSTVLNYNSFDPMISEKTKNWDIERIAIMDIILMKMALTELLKFPEIPVKVTLNEYIELSKMYSSQKSKIFINGVLDKLVAELESENKINKTGKGLMGKKYN